LTQTSTFHHLSTWKVKQQKKASQVIAELTSNAANKPDETPDTQEHLSCSHSDSLPTPELIPRALGITTAPTSDDSLPRWFVYIDMVFANLCIDFERQSYEFILSGLLLCECSSKRQSRVGRAKSHRVSHQ
jgi:hypothetical protein